MRDDKEEGLLTMTTDIVSAHLSNNVVAVGDVANVIAKVHAALAGLGSTAQAEPARAEPAVSIRTSVKPDAIACLECGLKSKMLKRHLQSRHGLTPAEYRTKWHLPASYPMVAPNYAETRRELAMKIGLGRKRGPKVAAKATGGKLRIKTPS